MREGSPENAVNAGTAEAAWGLCADCRHAQRVASSKGSVFLLCGLSKTNPEFPRYPRLPVRSCSGYDVAPRFSVAASLPQGLQIVDKYLPMLQVALEEARKGLAEGGIPIGAAIFDERGKLVGAGHNHRVQNNDPSAHGETEAFRNAGRQRSYRKLTMVTTLAPCWYCSGLIRQFGFARVVVGESRSFQGGVEWLRSLSIEVIDLDSQECVDLLGGYIRKNPEVWNEDIGEE